MSLPDATRSDRIYPLLQNLDLENLAFATLQGTGETLNIEEMNEDELRRLVLVNLARLTVKGEWDGLLTAASGGGDALTLLDVKFNGVSNYQTPALQDLGQIAATTQGQGGWLYYPFLAQYSGAIASISAHISATGASTGTIDVGIYTSTDGAPDVLLGFAQLDATSTGTKIDSSLSATITTVKGTQYWVGWFKNGTDANPTLYTSDANHGVGYGLNTILFTSESPTLKDESTVSPTSFNTPIDLTDLGLGGWPKLNIGLKW